MLKLLVILFIIKLYTCINFCKRLNAALCSNLTKACNFCFFQIKTFLLLPTQKSELNLSFKIELDIQQYLFFAFSLQYFTENWKMIEKFSWQTWFLQILSYFRSSRPEMPRRKHLYQSLFLIKLQACYFIKKETLAQVPQPCNFIEKETLAQVFSWEFCEISKGGLIR